MLLAGVNRSEYARSNDVGKREPHSFEYVHLYKGLYKYCNK